MAKRSQRMTTVQRVASLREQDAARALGAAQQVLAREQQRLVQLQQYLRDYQALMQGAGREGMQAGRLKNYGAFIAQVDRMIEAQILRIAQVEGQFEQARQRWVALRGRERAIGKLVDQFKSEEDYYAERRAQAEADDQFSAKRLSG